MDNTFEKLTEILRNGILAAMDEDNRYLYTDVVDYMMAHGVTLDNQVSSNKWIPVTERLPDHQLDDINARFLIVVKSKYPFDKDYSYDTDVAFFRDDGKGRLDGCWDALDDWGDGEDYLHVTHWMPLPEPPKGD